LDPHHATPHLTPLHISDRIKGVDGGDKARRRYSTICDAALGSAHRVVREGGLSDKLVLETRENEDAKWAIAVVDIMSWMKLLHSWQLPISLSPRITKSM
jgi:hypothetical protein